MVTVRDVTDDNPNANGNRQDAEPDWQQIFAAPDYASLIKPSRTATSREYATRTRSLLKMGLLASLSNQQYADAAAILYYGPSFAESTGQLADADDRAKRFLDILTAPESPYMMVLLTAIQLGSQLARNHNVNVAEMPATFRQKRATRKAQRERAKAEGKPVEKPKPLFTFRVLGRTIPVRVRAPFGLFTGIAKSLKSQTFDPNQLSYMVFSDPKVRRALHEQGFRVAGQESGPGNDDAA